MKKYKDRKGINLLTIFLVIDLLAVFASFKTSGAVYQAEAIGTTDLEVAFYAFETTGFIDEEDETQTMSINLGEIGPGETKVYRFKVYNTNNLNMVSDTNLSYVLKIITTTNLPLTYSLYYNESAYSKTSNDLLTTADGVTQAIHTDEYGTYFRTIVVPEKCFRHSEAKADFYYLTITMDENANTIDYQDNIESIVLQLTSKQVISSDISQRDLVCR